ncbi:MAG: hypothetical protein Q8L30_01050 [bacterium]|nr:hypothetical protein [bacterium]
MGHEGMEFERVPTGTGPATTDPKILATSALNGFPEDAMLYKELSSNPELLEKLALVSGVALDPEDMEKRSRMYAKINSTLHAKAGHAVEIGSALEDVAVLEAEQFLNKEIEKLTLLRDALRA